MNSVGWKYTGTSVIGSSHLQMNHPCQDACLCQVFTTVEGENVLVAVASDGAGSACFSDVGADLACHGFTEALRDHFSSGGKIEDITREFMVSLLESIRQTLSREAEQTETPLREYACTLLAAITGARSAVFFQIGDGAIVIAGEEEPDGYGWVFWPDKGEYDNTTLFITDCEAAENCRYEYTSSRITRIALFTDGLERLALVWRNQTVHTPFFTRLFTYLETAPSRDPEELAQPLTAFFSSPMVNARTDDDKTLIIAERIIG